MFNVLNLLRWRNVEDAEVLDVVFGKNIINTYCLFYISCSLAASKNIPGCSSVKMYTDCNRNVTILLNWTNTGFTKIYFESGPSYNRHCAHGPDFRHGHTFGRCTVVIRDVFKYGILRRKNDWRWMYTKLNRPTATADERRGFRFEVIEEEIIKYKIKSSS